MSRYLQAQPDGVLVWLSVRPPSLERRLFEHLLAAPQTLELNVPALAAALGHPVPSVARALFVLNRHASIAVQDGVAPLSAAASPAMRGGMHQGISGLDQDLTDICCEQGEIMLASDDGFCIAQAGLSPERAQWLAAQLPSGDGLTQSFRAVLCFGGRTLHFYASPGINLKHPLMLRMGVHLLQGCYLPSATTGNGN